MLWGAAAWAAGFAALWLTAAAWPEEPAMPAPGDAILCLGAGMSLQGWNLPDSASERRARACAALQVAGVAPVVVFTGYGHEVRSAADAMREVAVAAGMPAEAALVEPDALSTIQNAAFGLAMVPGARRVIVVSDAFHLPRSWVIFRAFGVEEVALYAAPPLPGDPPTPRGERSLLDWTLRESLAVWSNAARAAYYGLSRLAGLEHDAIIARFN